MASKGQTKGSRTGWTRYLGCVVYEQDGIILHGLYLDDRSGMTIPLHPVQLHGRAGTCCRRCMLNEGYFALVDDTMGYWYDPELQQMVNTKGIDWYTGEVDRRGEAKV